MKNKRHSRTIIAITVLLLSAGAASRASESGGIDPATATQARIDPDVILALVAEVRSLRIEILEHRLETYGQRIELLDRGLEGLAMERSEVDGKHDEMVEATDEIELQLQDPDLDPGERSYLEATRKELDWKRSRTIDRKDRTLDDREADLKARHKDLEKTRKRLAAHLRALTE